MANGIYVSYKQGLLDKLFDMNTDAIKASLVNTTGGSVQYTVNLSTHDEYSGASRDVPAGSIAKESATLTSPTIVNGVFDTADFVWTAVSYDSSQPCEAILLWHDPSTNDRLIANYDSGMTGMPVTPSGGDINVTVNPTGWFALV